MKASEQALALLKKHLPDYFDSEYCRRILELVEKNVSEAQWYNVLDAIKVRIDRAKEFEKENLHPEYKELGEEMFKFFSLADFLFYVFFIKQSSGKIPDEKQRAGFFERGEIPIEIIELNVRLKTYSAIRYCLYIKRSKIYSEQLSAAAKKALVALENLHADEEVSESYKDGLRQYEVQRILDELEKARRQRKKVIKRGENVSDYLVP